MKNPTEVRLLAKELIEGAENIVIDRIKTRIDKDKKQQQQQLRGVNNNDNNDKNPKTSSSIYGKGSRIILDRFGLNHTSTPVLYHQADNPNYNASKLNIVILQRKNAGWGSRHWTDDQANKLSREITRQFSATHNIVTHSSDALLHPDFCMACEVIEVNRADILIGFHGAGLTKEMFMKPGGLVFEVTGRLNAAVFPVCGYYGNWASIFGHNHYLYNYDIDNGDGINEEMNPVDIATTLRRYYDYLRTDAAVLMKAPIVPPSTLHLHEE
jgi:hypothetical protein